MKKRFNSHVRHAIAMFLVIVTFLNVPLYAYANVHTSSDSSYDDSIERGDIDGKYMPDNILARYEKSFEYCPLTPQEVLNPRSRIAIVDDAVYFVIIALFAACGLYLSKKAASSLASSFDTYLRRTSGNVASVMSAWNFVLSAKSGAVISGLKELYPLMKNFLKTNLSGYGTDTTEYKYVSGTGALDTGGPYNRIVYDDKGFGSSLEYKYFGSITDFDYSNYTLDLYFRYPNSSKIWYPVCFFVSSSDLCVFFISDDDTVNYTSLYTSYRRYDSDSNSFYYQDYIVSSFIDCTDVFSYPDGKYVNETYYLASVLNLPLFRNHQYAEQYTKYGYLDGQIVGTPDTSISADKSWSSLSDESYVAASDTITVPDAATQNTILSQLQFADTVTDTLSVLNPVLEIKKDGGGSIVTSTVAYSNLSYVLSVLAGYCGVALTDEQIKAFILDFYGSYVHGTSALVDDQAQAIIKKFVVINGGLQDPNDDNDKNKYIVLKTLAVALGSFLVSAGLVSDVPNFENEPAVSNNVQVVEKQDSSGSTSPDSGVDLSGVLDYLKQFLTILNTWANPFSLMDSLISKLGLPTLIDGLKAVINNIPKLISGELLLPELFGSVTDAIFSMPQQVADAIAKALGLEKALDNLGLSELFDNVIELLPGELVNGFALPDLFSGLGSVVGSIPSEISKIFGLVNGFSLSEWLNNISQSIQNLPSAFAEKFPSSSGSGNSEKEDSGDSGFRKFINALLLLALILVVLLIFFLNCLRFIVLLFQIPASSELFNEDILAGMNLLKTIVLPIFNVSFYSLLMGAVYFVIFMSIIGAIRKKINHIKIPTN